jgi:integrase/recombinase XerD
MGPSWKEVKKLLATTSGNKPVNIRDRAILMLFAVYGLRRKEVGSLQLEDLDWKHEVIRIRRAKNLKTQLFPLSKTVGDSILNYLRNVRPKKCSYRKIFLRINAPYTPLTPTGLTTIVARHFKPLKLPMQHHGPHALRYACASHLIQDENISLKQISEHLGHKSLKSTSIYAKVNIEGLRKVADFNMGGVL